MDSDYVLLLKTGQSELKAWAALPSTVRAHILPHIELTRGRKIASRINPRPLEEPDHRHIPGAYGFSKCVDTVAGILKEQEAVVLDITREDSLSCYEIDQLAVAENGYQNWLNFLGEIPLSGHRLYPTIIVNPDENTSANQYSADLNLQVARLFQGFPGICYRASVLADAEFLYDLMLIRDTVNNNIENGRRFILVLDHEFIRPSTGMVHAARTTGLVSSVLDLIPGANVVIMATSFPKSIEDIGHEEHDNFPIEERYLFEQVQRNVPANYRVTYGDYGSINPERMDMITRGWRPRIDFPTQNRRTFYYREKREIVGRDSSGKIIYDDYESHYASVAKKVVADSQFQVIENSWGCAQIRSAANDAVPGKSPSFWISVRMEIHIQQMVRTLGASGSSAISA